MVALRPTATRNMWVLIFLLSVLLFFAPSMAFAQEDDSTDPSDTPSPEASPLPEPAVAPEPFTPSLAASSRSFSISNSTATPAPTPAPASASNPAPAPSITTTPNPIFSTSDACVACQKEYYTVQNCSSHLPPTGVNLTMIVQLLPFYGCFCQNNYVEIDALQQCSTCFRSTRQLSYLRPQFYNVTNQGVKAFKMVCHETANGTRVSSKAGSGMWDHLMQSASLMVASTVLTVLLFFSRL
ncbi:hypothetical protein BC939DRAFT_279533 [Gamsiella multidivaricata]|uniref:uncharacterized protein n=1 Tax=Gamsiella multidivaricata TaxID=101098 RepID=UPI00221FA807|nr:uncharacterized protein BC939DRAFT_279533 [Gamsiella multidivaricata]KAI7830361.1 hypothetical protein BC939DRAFT_279533 [Gamsiella multidivaricata]